MQDYLSEVLVYASFITQISSISLVFIVCLLVNNLIDNANLAVSKVKVILVHVLVDLEDLERKVANDYLRQINDDV